MFVALLIKIGTFVVVPLSRGDRIPLISFLSFDFIFVFFLFLAFWAFELFVIPKAVFKLCSATIMGN